MLVNNEHKQIIEERFEAVREAAKHREEELFGVLNQCTEDEAICLKYLYAFMPEQDLANHDGELFLKFVRHALKVRQIVPWGDKLTGGLFLNYVLQYRMSNENVEFYKDDFFEELYPRIEGKSMKEAALIINYWCFEKATYQTTDSRTTCPLTTLRNAYGRCGEESVLGVAAFRSVGIPARQAYTPRWAHCDDNHAWVEVWTDGEWHFLGACEPEATLDSGWFQLSASRGMLIQSKVFATTVENELITRQTDSATEVNTLDRYAATKEITVTVQDAEGNLVEGAHVRFEVVNYSELFPLTEIVTDAKGEAKFVTGFGDLVIYVHKDGVATYDQIDVRLDDMLTVVLEDKARTHGRVETITLVPPKGASPDENAIDEATRKNHEACHQHALKTRKAFVETFFLGEKATEWAKDFAPFEEGVEKHLESARGNYEEIQAFFKDEETYNLLEYKVKMLNTMKTKDLSDTSCEILKAHLQHALQFADDFEEETFVKGILAPRIATEKITPYRQGLEVFFDEEAKVNFKQNPRSIYDYVDEYIATATSAQNVYLCAQPVGMMKVRLGHVASKKLLFVALCRTFGIPAKLNKENGNMSYFQNGTWIEIEVGVAQEEVVKNSTLTLKAEDDTVYEYMKNYTVGRYVGDVYRTLYLGTGEWVDGSVSYPVEAGEYRIVTVNREASGTVHANLYYVDVKENETVALGIKLAEVNNAHQKEIIVKEATFMNANGDVCELSEVTQDTRNIVAFLDAGAEPTEHLLNEMIEAKEQYLELEPSVVLVVEEAKDLDNPTLQKTIAALPFIKVYVGYNKEDLTYLYEDFEILDKKLPLAYVMNKPMIASMAIAGYNVGIGTMLLKYLEAK
ncbi:MAG: transglutaminase domain-containing protein [Niameybacter sp.]|uniref:transglutaminase domain-containing protein n=1 Tax=Niameybacter sp. TaxID=2033640 RepID=UPI002FC822C6